MRSFTVRVFFLIITLGVLSISTGCKQRLLPNSSVEDNSNNRVIAGFLAEYVKAVELRSTDAVMALVSSDYSEKFPADGSEGLRNYEDLKAKLEKLFSRTKELKVNLYLQKIIPKDGRYEVYYIFKENALMEFPSGTRWMSASDTNRLLLRKKGAKIADGLEILSGL